MNTPHKHAAVLVAIAEGRDVQTDDAWGKDSWFTVYADCLDFESPLSKPNWNWRVKPTIESEDS